MNTADTRRDTPAVVITDLAAPAPRRCFWCYGTGRVPNDHHERYDRCEPCDGTGVRTPPPAIGPHGLPSVQIVAEAA